LVSFVSELNAATSAGHSATVSGMSFGSLDVTPSIRLGLTSCATTAWVSSSTVVCVLAAGYGPQKDLAVTVEGIVGTRTRTFSYDG
jgi:hypothetical protein